MGLPKNVALTVDLEEWTVAEDYGRERVPGAVKLNVARQGLYRILKILATQKVKATFFVTAYFAENNERILRNMLEAGHEIGNHGLRHARRIPLNLKQETEAIQESTKIIKSVTGRKPCGYREPYLAITTNTITALMRTGYAYDSSILGTWLPRKSKWLQVPSTPFVWKTRNNGNLLELPLSTLAKLRIPAGWWWLRKNLGNPIPLASANLLFQKAHPFIMNVHTWELAEPPPNLTIPLHIRHNCGHQSARQIINLIAALKSYGAQFTLMKTVAKAFQSTQLVTYI